MFKLMDKKIIAILRKLFLLNWPYDQMLYSPKLESLQFSDNNFGLCALLTEPK